MKGKSDALFSKIIRSRGSCLRCGSRDYLQCAHVISRRYSNTRCDLRNAWCLCSKCHLRLTNWPVEHTEFIEKTIGLETYAQLRAKAMVVDKKVDWAEIYAELRKYESHLTLEGSDSILQV